MALAVLLSWWLNRTFTFRAAAVGGSRWREAFKFILSQLPGAGINAFVSVLAFNYLPLFHHNAWAATACGSAAGLSANFLMAHLFVFNKPRSAQ